MCTNSQQRGRWSADQPTAASSDRRWSIRNCSVLPPEPPRPTTPVLYPEALQVSRSVRSGQGGHGQVRNGSCHAGRAGEAGTPDANGSVPDGPPPKGSPLRPGAGDGAPVADG